jgi:hypothetical protein
MNKKFDKVLLELLIYYEKKILSMDIKNKKEQKKLISFYYY